jgi:serine/threonine-protein kinase haspin
VVKIGEGTYGEAFKSGQVVLKFVPMEGDNLINGWPQKGAGDLLGEAVIALALTDLGREVDESGEGGRGFVYVDTRVSCLGLCWWLGAAHDEGAVHLPSTG